MRHPRHIVVILALSALCLAAAALAEGSSEQERKRAAEIGLKPGLIIDQTSAALAAEYLPPEILKHYQNGDYKNEIVEWPRGKEKLAPAFVAQTERNAETLAINVMGTIIDKATGKQPPAVYGTPFPRIDPSDPQAGVKIIWNYLYTANWWNGNSSDRISLVLLNPTGVDRQVGQDVRYRVYDGVPPDLRPPENPNNLLAQFIAITTKPADLSGTTALSWRYRDPDKRDSVWAFVPALRRARAVSPANRSDGFLGSDMSQDDGQFFDGKPEDFIWTLAGEREVLRFVDPYRLSGDVAVAKLPGGGWAAVLKQDPAYGFKDTTWTGVAWAMIAYKLALREAWVVEGVPKDRYYLYGKLELLIDKENYQGAYNRKFSWSGELLNTLQAAGGPSFAVDDTHSITAGPGSGVVGRVAENIKVRRATIVDATDGMLTRHVPLEASLFDYQTLHRLGK